MPVRDFDSIYTDFSRMVYWTAYGVTKSAPEAEDAMQSVFVKVLMHLAKLQAMSDPQLKGWLYRVTVNLCLDGKRRKAHEVITSEDYDLADTDESVLPEPSAITRETVETVRAAVDALPDIYRNTVQLHYFAGLEYEEIARLTGVSEGTVKSRMFRARDRLCALLKEGEYNG